MPRYKSSVYEHQSKFICNYCDEYEVTSKKGLDLHIKHTHGVEKATQNPQTSYDCNTCGKKFRERIDLLSHFKTHRI